MVYRLGGSMKCPKCGSRMNRLYIQYKEGGKIFWKPLNGYYCRKCRTIILFDEHIA